MNRGAVGRALGAVSVLVIALVVGACGATHGSSAPPVKGPSATLRLSYPPGAYAYGYQASVNGTETLQSGDTRTLDMDLSADGSWQVQPSGQSGASTVTATFRNVKVSHPGSQTSSELTFVFGLAPDGVVSYQRGALPSAGSPVTAPGVDQFLAILPSHSVRPRQSWSSNVSQPNPFGVGTISYTASSRLLQYETVGGQRDAKVRTRTTIPVDLVVDLAKAARGTGQTAAPPPQGQARYKGTVKLTNTTLIGLKSHRVDEATNVADVDLQEIPLASPSGQPVPSFKGTETIHFHSQQ